MPVHRLAEEDDRLDVVDGASKRVPVETLPNVADGVVIRVRNRVRIRIPPISIAEADEPRPL